MIEPSGGGRGEQGHPLEAGLFPEGWKQVPTKRITAADLPFSLGPLQGAGSASQDSRRPAVHTAPLVGWGERRGCLLLPQMEEGPRARQQDKAVCSFKGLTQSPSRSLPSCAHVYL